MLVNLISEIHIIILFLITLVYFLIASYEDFKKKEVYNYINFSFIFVVFFWSFFMSIYFLDINYLYISFIGAILGFFIGSFLFYIGTWGGGDAKFMIGFGAAFAHFSSNIFSFIVHRDDFAILLDTFLIHTIDILVNASYTMIFITTVVLLILLGLTLLRIKHKYLMKNSFLLMFLLFLQIVSLLDFFSIYIRILTTILTIITLFLLPQSSFIQFGKFKKKTLNEVEELIKQQKVCFITKDIYHKKKCILNFKDSSYGLSNDDILTLKKYLDPTSKIEIVQPISINFLLILNFLISILLFTTSSLFSTSSILIHLIEFILISFLVGGVYVLLLVIYYIISNFNKCLCEISPSMKKILSIVLPILLLLYIISNGIVKSIIAFLLIISILFTFYLFTKIIEKYLFVSKVDINQLSPGDWIIQDIIIKDKIIYKKEDFKLGVNEDQLKVLKKYENSNKIKTVMVKSGIAFIPFLFIAFIILLALSLL